LQQPEKQGGSSPSLSPNQANKVTRIFGHTLALETKQIRAIVSAVLDFRAEPAAMDAFGKHNHSLPT
jgi:hypothetical protein